MHSSLIGLVLLGFAGQQTAHPSDTGSCEYYYAPGKSFYHLPNCRWLRKDERSAPATPEVISEKGLYPCPMCKPRQKPPTEDKAKNVESWGGSRGPRRKKSRGESQAAVTRSIPELTGTVTIVNKSGGNVLVLLVGPSEAQLWLANGEQERNKVKPGSYYTLVHFQTPRGFSYGRGESFTVKANSVHTITLRLVKHGNYPIKPIDKDEFENARQSITKKLKVERLPGAEWPPSSGKLDGRNPLCVRNPNSSDIRVAIRCDGRGHDVTVPGGSSRTLSGPNGGYHMYFQFDTDPEALHRVRFAICDQEMELQIPRAPRPVRRQPPLRQEKRVRRGPARSQHLQQVSEWPPFRGTLVGRNPVRIKNPNDFQVKVGLRRGTEGIDMMVPARGTRHVTAPNGSYEVYYQPSSEPGTVFGGSGFNLKNNGVEITVTIIKDVVGGGGFP